MLIMLLLLFFSVLPGLGFQQASKVQDLQGFPLPSSNIRITQAMQTIILTMNQVEKLPSCQKVASQALLNSCSDLDHTSAPHSDKDLDSMLETTKSIYAVRLAICELIDANADIPASCFHFRPQENIPKSSGIYRFMAHHRSTKSTSQETYDHETDRSLDQCSLALSSKPQWWTSYSNARQNAVLMCHSMRTELDKDDMIQKMKLMIDALMEAASTMSDTTEEFRVFEESWTQMGKGMESFHVALNSDLEMQKRITDQWARFQSSVVTLDNDIQDLGRGITLIKDATSEIASELATHRAQNEAAQVGVAQHLEHFLDLALQVDRSQDASMAYFLAINQHTQNIATSLARNIETADSLNRETQNLLRSITSITDNVTDAAKTVSEFHKDINSLPAKLLHQLFEASVRYLPFGLAALPLFGLFWGLCFAFLEKWGGFRFRGTVVVSLAICGASTHFFSHIPKDFTSLPLNVVGVVGLALFAMLATNQWYKKQSVHRAQKLLAQAV